jgi:hypothetical protein
MQTFHFTELREFAVTDKIERGRIYYYCHPKCGDYQRDWFPMNEEDEEYGWQRPTAQAYPLLAASGLVTIRNGDTFQRGESWHTEPEEDSYWREPSVGWWSLSGRRHWFDSPSDKREKPQFQHASDSGVIGGWGNFILDKNALLRQGIAVDLSTLDLLEPAA